MSRTPVRQALLMLAAEDLVQLLPNRGAVVAPVPARQITEVMRARGPIERWAAATCLDDGRSTGRAGDGGAGPAAGHRDGGSARELIDLDRQFHELLVGAAGNTALARLCEMLRARHVLLGVVALQRSSGRGQQVLEEHQAIVDALAVGDRRGAEAMISRHLDTTGDVLSHS